MLNDRTPLSFFTWTDIPAVKRIRGSGKKKARVLVKHHYFFKQMFGEFRPVAVVYESSKLGISAFLIPNAAKKLLVFVAVKPIEKALFALNRGCDRVNRRVFEFLFTLSINEPTFDCIGKYFRVALADGLA